MFSYLNQEHVKSAIQEIIDNHDKIIEDWSKAYIAQLYQENGKMPKPGDYILHEQVPTLKDEKLVKRYWFELNEKENLKSKNCTELSLDITEAIATWKIEELKKLFDLLLENKFEKINFDGNNAIIFATKKLE